VGWLQGKLGNGKHATMRVSKPLARTESLVIEDLDDEILIYDQLTARAHCLSGPAAMVWRACDGDLSEDALSASLGLEAEMVGVALAELETNGLLDVGPVAIVNGNGHTRREFTISTAKVGAAAAAAPMIYSILAPTPAAAATPSVAQCLFYSAKSCNGCTNICGCCCCCEGCPTATTAGGQAGCKICLPTKMCSVTYFTAGCENVPGVNAGGCSSGPNCSSTAPDGPLCPPVSAPVLPSGSDKCCYPPCTTSNGVAFATLADCGNSQSGGIAQPCNCTQEASPCH
jgi:hypothetical protein